MNYRHVSIASIGGRTLDTYRASGLTVYRVVDRESAEQIGRYRVTRRGIETDLDGLQLGTYSTPREAMAALLGFWVALRNFQPSRNYGNL